MKQLDLDIARCPGAPLRDMVTLRLATDSRCADCARFLQARSDISQWRLDGCPRIEGGKPRLSGDWMQPADRDQWIDGVCPNHLAADHQQSTLARSAHVGALLLAAVLAVGAATAPTPASATEVGLHTVTRHARSTQANGQPYQSATPGLYLRTDAGLTLGVLRNSIGRASVYAGMTWSTDMSRPVSAAVTVGGITGYLDTPVRPLLVPSLSLRATDAMSVRLIVLPKHSPKSSAALTLSAEWRL